MMAKDIRQIKMASGDVRGQLFKPGRITKQGKNALVLRNKFKIKSKIVFDRLRLFRFKHFFKGQFKRGLIKSSNGRIIPKVFTKKINLNKIQIDNSFDQSKEANKKKVLLLPNQLKLKASFYLLLKSLKEAKKATLTLTSEENSLDPLNKLCIGLEKSGFYVSLAEWEKNRNFSHLKMKTKKKLCNTFLSSLKAENGISYDLGKLRPLISINEPYQNFQKKLKKRRDDLVKRKSLAFVNLKKKYTPEIESRILRYMSLYNKKYTQLLQIMKSYKFRFRRLFFYHNKKRLRHSFRIKERYKLYRSLARKRKKRRSRKKVGLYYFLRKRPRMLFRFYVPRHLEVNYKTFSLAHLGGLDLPSVSSRISSWLNLRRLLTSLAM